MQICFSIFSSICILSFVFYLFASWNSLLQLTGFLIFLLCLRSRSQMHSDEVTKSAKSGTKNIIYTTDGPCFWGFFTFRCESSAVGAVHA